MQKCEIVLVKFDGRSWSNLEQGDTFAGTVYAFTLHDVVENHQQREIMLTMPFFFALLVVTGRLGLVEGLEPLEPRKSLYDYNDRLILDPARKCRPM